MKIIDHTPLLDANGQLSVVNRIQGVLKYGPSWPANLDAQQKVIAQLNKAIEKGYVLFRNQKLGTSEIIVPLILVGASGIYVMDATPLKGFYRARGDEWGTVVNERFQPADINILGRVARMAKVVQVFFERQGATLAAPVEPILIAADPGMHIESVRPSVRVVMSDAIDRFAASLLTGRPIYNSPMVNELVDRIQNPRSPRQQDQPPPEPKDDAFAMKDETPFPAMEPSRMSAILNAPKSDALIETGQSDVGFALEDGASASAQPTVMVNGPKQPGGEEYPTAAPASNRILGMTVPQVIILAGLLLFECCILLGFGGLIYYLQQQFNQPLP